jgi:hypothetical protein
MQLVVVNELTTQKQHQAEEGIGGSEEDEDTTKNSAMFVPIE